MRKWVACMGLVLAAATQQAPRAAHAVLHQVPPLLETCRMAAWEEWWRNLHTAEEVMEIHLVWGNTLVELINSQDKPLVFKVRASEALLLALEGPHSPEAMEVVDPQHSLECRHIPQVWLSLFLFEQLC